MFSSFPTTRHASDLERRTTETGDGRGDDFDAHGARTWASNGFLSRDGFSDAEEDDFEEEEEDRDGGSKAGKGRRRGVAKNVAQLSKSPRSPKEAFDGNTGNARDALFPIDGEVNNCLRLVTEGDAPWNTPKISAICLACNEDVVSERQPIGTNKYRRKAGTVAINEEFMEQGYNGGATTNGKARTGDCVVTKGGRLPGVKHLVHCVVPRYVEKYKTAAETALVHCYRNALSMCIEDEVGSRNVGLTLLHRDERKCYPRKEGAEVLARTVRRFLENWAHKLESVVILFPDEETKAFYEKDVLPIYFPRNLIELQRSREEAMECDENGERVIVGRTISIDAFPSRHDEMPSNGSTSDDSSIGEDEDLATARGERANGENVNNTDTTNSQKLQQKERKSVEIAIECKGGRRSPHGKGLLKADKHSISNKSMNNISEVLNVPLGVTIATPATGATFISQHETPEERRARLLSISQGTIEPWLLLNESTKLNANFDQSLSSVEDTTNLENEEIEYAKLLRDVSHSLDKLSTVETVTRAVTTETHADFAGRRIITIIGAFAERMLREGEGDLLAMSLANNVVNATQEGASSGFIIIYHHTGQYSDSLTSEQFEMLLSKALGPAHCQAQLKALYVVHPGTKMKVQCWWSSLGINRNDGACAALGKAVYVNTLEDLNAYVRVQGGEELYVPAHVKDFDASVAVKGMWY